MIGSPGFSRWDACRGAVAYRDRLIRLMTVETHRFG